MFCFNCGNSLNEGSKFCPNCGMKVKEDKVIVQSQTEQYVTTNRSGLATASLVLGIIDVVFVVFSCLLTVSFSAYIIDKHASILYHLTDSEVVENIATVILINILPFLMAATGLPLGLFSNVKNKDNKGFKIAGIILNTITVFLCIIQLIVVVSLTFSAS